MAARLSTSEIKKVFTYPFQDPKWAQKWLIGILLLVGDYIIPVIPLLIVLGYFYRIMHRIIHEDGEAYLPEWGDFGKLLKDGWRIFCVYFVYLFPPVLIKVVGTIVYYGGLFYAVSHVRAMGMQNYLLLICVFMQVMYMCSALSIALSGLALVFAPPAMCNAVLREKMTAGFSFSDWWPVLKANFSGFFLGMVVFMGLEILGQTCARFFVMTMVLGIAAPLVIVLRDFYEGLACSALFSLAFREGLEKSNRAVTAVPAVE